VTFSRSLARFSAFGLGEHGQGKRLSCALLSLLGNFANGNNTMHIMLWHDNVHFAIVGPFANERAARSWCRFNGLKAFACLSNLPTYVDRKAIVSPFVAAVKKLDQKQALVAPSKRKRTGPEVKARFAPTPAKCGTLKEWRDRNEATQHFRD